MVIIQGSEQGKEVQFQEAGIILGRGQDVGMFFRDPEASRQHARIDWEDGSFTLIDLGSSNGTYLNGVKIVGREILSPGDLITVGETVLEFQSIFQPDTRGEAARTGVDSGGGQEGKSASAKGKSSRVLIFGGAAIVVFLCLISAILLGAFVIIPKLNPESSVVYDDPPVSVGNASLEIVNMHSEDICAMQISPSTNEEWGGNWLADGVVLRSGSSISFDIEPGMEYDFIAYTCFESVLVERYEIFIGDGANVITVEPGN